MSDLRANVLPRALPSADAVRRGRFYLLLIVGLLALLMIGQIVMVVVATRDPAFSLEPDYYQKAIGYDAHMQQAAKNRALGWRVQVLAFGGEGLRMRLVDGAGAAIDDAKIDVEGFPVARGRELRRASLSWQGAGAYAGLMSSLRPGIWELRFTVDARGERFTQTARAELPATRAEKR